MHEAKWSRAKDDADKDDHEAALFERPFRAQETNAPHGCGLDLHFSSMLRLQGRLEQHPSSILGCGLELHFSSMLRLYGRLERHLSSILRLRSRLERHPSSILRLRGRFDRHFSSIVRFRGELERHFEPSAAPGRARAAISSHLRLRAMLDS